MSGMGLFGLGEPTSEEKQARDTAYSRQQELDHIVSLSRTELGAEGKISDVNAQNLALKVRANLRLSGPELAAVMEALGRGIKILADEDSANK